METSKENRTEYLDRLQVGIATPIADPPPPAAPTGYVSCPESELSLPQEFNLHIRAACRLLVQWLLSEIEARAPIQSDCENQEARDAD